MKKLENFARVLSKNEQKTISGGTQGEQCCTLYCMDGDTCLLGTVSVSSTCPTQALQECQDFYPATTQVGCQCTES